MGCAGTFSLAMLVSPKRRLGSTRVPGLALILVWRPSRRMVVYIYYVTTAENSVSSQLGSSRATGTERKRRAVYGSSIMYKITPAGSLLQLASRAAMLGQPSSLRPHWVPLLRFKFCLWLQLPVSGPSMCYKEQKYLTQDILLRFQFKASAEP